MPNPPSDNNPHPSRFAHTPSGLTAHVLQHRGCPIHYWTGGREDAGALLVFMHGALMDHRMFNAQVERFAPEYGVLLWDARGHGESQPLGLPQLTIEDYAADMIALLDHVCAPEVVLIGQSMGAYTAQHLVRLYPERVRGLVVIGSTPIAFPVSAAEMAALRFSLTAFRAWPYGSLAKMMARNTTVKPDVAAYALETIGRIDRQTFLSIWAAVNTAVRRQGYPDFNVRVPFLLTHGDHDVTGTIRRDAPRWAASDPAIRYVVIPDAGHNANQDNPGFTNHVLAEFLDKVTSQGHFAGS